MGLLRKRISQQGDEHHAKCFDAESRTLTYKGVIALRFTQGVVGVAINLAVGCLAAVDQDVAYAAKAFLKGFDDLCGFTGDALAVEQLLLLCEFDDACVDKPKATKGGKRNNGVDRQQCEENS